MIVVDKARRSPLTALRCRVQALKLIGFALFRSKKAADLGVNGVESDGGQRGRRRFWGQRKEKQTTRSFSDGIRCVAGRLRSPLVRLPPRAQLTFIIVRSHTSLEPSKPNTITVANSQHGRGSDRSAPEQQPWVLFFCIGSKTGFLRTPYKAASSTFSQLGGKLQFP